MSGKRRRPGYTNEAELCAEFIAAARAHGFRAYPETADFDILLVATERCEGFQDGDQIGIQAKRFPNLAVVAQALPHRHGVDGPHYYAVLVPHSSDELRRVATRLQITVLVGPNFSNIARSSREFRRVHWWRQDSTKLCWVPECEVEGLAAGRSAPQQLTPWKMNSVKLCLLAVDRGYLTADDFREHSVSMTFWRNKGWLESIGFHREGDKRMKRYVLVESAMPPHLKYAEVAEALKKARSA